MMKGSKAIRTHLEFDDFGEYVEVFDEADGELFFVETPVRHTDPDMNRCFTAA